MSIAEHEPDKLYKRNKAMLNMSHQQLHDFASTKGEHTPVHMLKREGVSLEGSEASKRAGKAKHFEKADYISGSRNNPHSAGRGGHGRHYEDHGAGEDGDGDESPVRERKSSYRRMDH